jgi:hypothetical protein
MKTDDLIAALALEPGFPGPGRVAGRLALWSGAGALLAGLLTVAAMGPRPDLGEGAGLASLFGKAGFTLSLAAAGFWLTRRLGQPGVSARQPLVALTLLIGGGAAAMALELAWTPPGARAAQLMGHSAVSCPLVILGLGLLILGPALAVARRLAPLRPGAAGAAVGLLAGGLSATAYGLHCAEPAVSFLVVWYGLGVLATTAVGAALGTRILRW